MKILTPALLLLLLAEPCIAQDIESILSSAQQVNQTYRETIADYELAYLRYQRADIQAGSDLERLSARLTLFAAQQARSSGMRQFRREVVDAVYGAVIADYDRQIANLQLEYARNTVASLERSYRNGMTPERDVIEARIEVESESVDAEQADWDFRVALDTLLSATGLPPAELELPAIPNITVELSSDEWTDTDWAVRRALLEADRARLERDLLPSNAPRFDVVVAERTLDQARLAIESAVADARLAHTAMVRRMQSERSIISIRTEELRLSRSLREEARESFARGMVTALARDLTAIRALTAERDLIVAERALMRTIADYSVVLADTSLDESR